jgi:hypothetical protein
MMIPHVPARGSHISQSGGEVAAMSDSPTNLDRAIAHLTVLVLEALSGRTVEAAAKIWLETEVDIRTIAGSHLVRELAALLKPVSCAVRESQASAVTITCVPAVRPSDVAARRNYEAAKRSFGQYLVRRFPTKAAERVLLLRLPSGEFPVSAQEILKWQSEYELEYELFLGFSEPDPSARARGFLGVVILGPGTGGLQLEKSES